MPTRYNFFREPGEQRPPSDPRQELVLALIVLAVVISVLYLVARFGGA